MGSAIKSIANPVASFANNPSGAFGEFSNFMGDITGTNAQAEAAQRAAMAQQDAARRQQAMILGRGNKEQQEAMKLAQASPQELQAYERSLSSSLKQLEQRERQIAAIDPAIMEASDQVLKLLRGERAGSTDVVLQQRQKQRQELVNTLRSQFGPGAETSSMGQQRLQQFDMETNSLTQGAQQNALSQVFGIAGNAGALNDRNSALGALNNAGTNFSNLQNRQLNARMQTGSNILSGIAGTSQSMIQSAGAQYTGDMVRGQAQQQLFNTLGNAGMAYASGGMSAIGGPQAQSTVNHKVG